MKSYNETIEQTGLENLEHMPIFLRWVYKQVQPWLGQRVLEAGAGIGTYVNYMVKDNKEVYALEFSDNYFLALKKRFIKNKLVHTIKADITFFDAMSPLESKKIDTILSINVLEHIKDDQQVLNNMFNILTPGGRMVILVPAYPWLYSSLDHALGHHRRYSAGQLFEKVQRSGFVTEKSFYFNFLAILGWYVNGKILKKNNVNHDAARLYNLVVPIARFIETFIIRKRVGVSLIIVAKKPIRE